MHGQETTVTPMMAAKQNESVGDEQLLKLIRMVRELKSMEKIADDMAKFEQQKSKEGRP